MKRLLLFLLSSMFLLLFNLPSVYACSGGEYPYPTIDSMLERSVLVRGTVIENSGGNSIIEVERYLQGSGSRYLFVYRQSPQTYITKHVRGYNFGCNYALQPLAEVGTRAYFSLHGGESGIYGITYYEEEHIFPIANREEGQIVYYGEDVDGYTEHQSATLEQFEALIAERTGNPGTDPDEYSQRLRFRTLTIRTESGQSYRLPINSNEIYPIEASNTVCTENCTIVSPDGSHYLVPIPNETDAYWAWYYPNPNGDDWSQGFQDGDYRYYPSEFHAQSVLFSPNSDYLLAWYEDSITLYSFYPWSASYGDYPELFEAWSAQLAVRETMSAESFRGLAAWSGNSNAFAYWDADGLKWLDMSTMQVPSLILQYEDIPSLAHLNSVGSIPPLLELSNTGRYIRYGEVDEWILLDTLTGSEYDDVLVSPGETEFIAIAPEVSPYQYRNQAEEGECLMFDLEGNCLIRRERYGEMCVAPMVACATPVSLHDFQLRGFYWYDNSNAIYFACESSENNLCFVRQAPLEQIYSSQAPASYQTNAFAYDDYYGYLAWATDNYHLRLSTYIYDEPLDFSAVLDSPIVSLEWGAPLWYLGEEG